MFDNGNIVLNSKEKVYGIIYKITNLENNKIYIGQTLSHRKNHNRYRPFGHIGRFNDHISEAICNTKPNQCSYLNQAIRKYGKEIFSVEELEKCNIEDLDEREKYYIYHTKSLYPNGYNLTIGGKNLYVKTMKTNEYSINTQRITNHTDLTKQKIGEGIKTFYKTFPEKKLELAKRIQNQHYGNKIKIGIQYAIDENNIDQYISVRKNIVVIIFERKRDGKKVNFCMSKGETIDDTIIRAKKYIQDVINERNKSLQHHQIAGTP